MERQREWERLPAGLGNFKTHLATGGLKRESDIPGAAEHLLREDHGWRPFHVGIVPDQFAFRVAARGAGRQAGKYSPLPRLPNQG